jgi:hypothetical protein
MYMDYRNASASNVTAYQLSGAWASLVAQYAADHSLGLCAVALLLSSAQRVLLCPLCL